MRFTSDFKRNLAKQCKSLFFIDFPSNLDLRQVYMVINAGCAGKDLAWLRGRLETFNAKEGAAQRPRALPKTNLPNM